MAQDIFKQLIIFEMANNHGGELKHGLRIIRALHDVSKPFAYRFAIKFQYRDLDHFIHPDWQGRSDSKYVSRFQQTRLSDDDFLRMKNEAAALGFLTVCTPFDEVSVDKVQKQNFDILKIASCSFTDWPLLEAAVKTDLPMILSTAGASIDDIDRVVTFLQHRDKSFCLMHCVGAYPTEACDLALDQIDFFRERYPGLPVGFSTHENPSATLPVKLAVAKGARVLERHVGLADDKHSLNAYSSNPEQIVAWLSAIQEAQVICGNCREQRRSVSSKEADDLRGLQRGVFLKHDVPVESNLTADDFFFAIPNQPDQMLANHLSKYLQIKSKIAIPQNAPLLYSAVDCRNTRSQVLEIVRDLCDLIKKSQIRLQNKLDLELSHHFGIDQFDRFGCSIITCVNREYCKKIILLLPGQCNPEHAHTKKEESFHLIYGDLSLSLDGEERNCQVGDIILVERGVKHAFSSQNGAVLEEISTRHYANDSAYSDSNIGETATRKTYLTFYADWMEGNLQ